jgi:phosphoribosyl 1,2-cyclic phosphodiesterase
VSGTITHWQRDAIAGFYMLTKMQIEQAKVNQVGFIESSEANLMFYCFAMS